MAISLTAYPVLTRDLRVKTGYYPMKYTFDYRRNGTLTPLESQPTSEYSTSNNVVSLKLMDKNAAWHPDEYGLNIHCKCAVNTPVFLFGPKGIASKTSVIGVAVQWTAREAGIRGVEPVGEIRNNSRAAIIEGKICFGRQTIKGTISLKTVYYLKKAGKPEISEMHLANTPGMILGELDETRLLIDGNGSVFPIVETNAPGEPLWWVDCNWNDPREDSFTEENFCIHLNTAHKDYPSLSENEGLRNSPLLAEIIATALQILITNVLSDPGAAGDTKKGYNLQPGSISSVVNYFMHSFNWDMNTNNPEKIAISIRKDLMRRM